MRGLRFGLLGALLCLAACVQPPKQDVQPTPLSPEAAAQREAQRQALRESVRQVRTDSVADQLLSQERRYDRVYGVAGEGMVDPAGRPLSVDDPTLRSDDPLLDPNDPLLDPNDPLLQGGDPLLDPDDPLLQN
jgi:hypothetical protein